MNLKVQAVGRDGRPGGYLVDDEYAVDRLLRALARRHHEDLVVY
jgi:hypothetical protein